MLCTHTARTRAKLVELAEELADGGDVLRAEVVYLLRVDGDADATGLGVHAEGRLEQVVAVFRDFGVEPGVGVLQDDVLHRGLHDRVMLGRA